MRSAKELGMDALCLIGKYHQPFNKCEVDFTQIDSNLLRTLSMTMGRPISIPEQFVKIELPQTLPGSELEDETSAQFFTATMSVYENSIEKLNL